MPACMTRPHPCYPHPDPNLASSPSFSSHLLSPSLPQSTIKRLSVVLVGVVKAMKSAQSSWKKQAKAEEEEAARAKEEAEREEAEREAAREQAARQKTAAKEASRAATALEKAAFDARVAARRVSAEG